MEYWKSKADVGPILISDSCYPHKIRSHSAKPIIPTLQYSIIPLCRITAQPIFSDLAQLPARRVGPTARREDQVFIVRIKFYRFDTGKCPVEDFFDRLNDKQFEKISFVLDLIEQIDIVPRKFFKKLKGPDMNNDSKHSNWGFI